jgi:hypothetical protein
MDAEGYPYSPGRPDHEPSITCHFSVRVAGFEPMASLSRSNNNSALISTFQRL